MTTTPNPTAEQIVHDAIYGTKLMEPELRTLLANDSWALTRKAVAALCAVGLLGGDPTEEQIQAESWSMFPELEPDYASMTYPADAMRTYNRSAFVSGARWAAASFAPKADAKPIDTAPERAKNLAESSHVAQVELDPEKVAEVLSSELRGAWRNPGHLARVLCEAAKRGELSA